LLDIAERSGLPFARIHDAASLLLQAGLLAENKKEKSAAEPTQEQTRRV